MRRPRGRRPRSDGEAALGGVDRVLETRVEPEAAVALGERGPACDRARHRHRPRPGLRDRLGVRRGRRRPRGVEPLELAVPPDLREAVAADPGRHRLGDAQDGGGGQRRVGGVPAALERAQPRTGRERLARGDHPLRRDRGRPSEGKAVTHSRRSPRPGRPSARSAVRPAGRSRASRTGCPPRGRAGRTCARAGPRAHRRTSPRSARPRPRRRSARRRAARRSGRRSRRRRARTRP